MFALPLIRHHASLWGYFWRGLKISIMLLLMLWLYCAWQVMSFGKTILADDYHADVAVVLGAAAWDVRPSPVFRERLNHALDLYQQGRVQKLALTGGTPKTGFMTEADVGKRFFMQKGVPEKDIVLENQSRNTYENLVLIRKVLHEHGLRKVVIVSDPYHLARAARIAQNIDFQADFSGTPSTRYTQWQNKSKFIIQETSLLFAYYLWQVGGRYLP